MRKILSISIKIMIVFQAIYHSNYYTYYFQRLIMSIHYKIDIISIIIGNVLPLVFQILLLCFVWIKSYKISEIIFHNNEEYLININFKEIISTLIIVITIYFIISNINLLVYNICNFITYRINIIKGLNHIEYDPAFRFDYSRYITNIVSNVIECIISLLILINRKKIIKYFDNI